jgi:translocation and assembly module TamB
VHFALRTASIGRARVRRGLGAGRSIDAEVVGAVGSLDLSASALAIEVSRSTVEARGVTGGADVAGSLSGGLLVPREGAGLPDAHGAWLGSVGGIAHCIRGSLSKGALEANLDVYEASPAAIRSVWPASPIERPARLHLRAAGPLAAIDVSTFAAVGDASANVRGHVVLDGDKRGRVTVDARAFDVHEIVPSAPRSALGVTAELTGAMSRAGSLQGAADVRFLGGAMGEIELPPASIHASASRDRSGRLGAAADARIEEPGAPMHLTLGLDPGSQVLSFRLDADAPRLQDLPALGKAVTGKAAVASEGRLDLAGRVIDAQLRAHADDVERGASRIGHASVQIQAQGPLDAPVLDAHLQAKDAVARAVHLRSLELTASGQAPGAHVTASVRAEELPSIEAAADVSLGDGVSVSSLRAELARAGERSTVGLQQAKVGGRELRIDGLRVEGLGAPLTASAARDGDTWTVQVNGPALDLGRLARLVHLERRLQGGTVALYTDARLLRESADGHVKLDAEHVAVADAKEIAAHLDASLSGRTLTGTLHASAPGIGTLDAAVPNLALARGAPLSPRAWRKASGSFQLALRADLGRLSDVLPAETAPWSEARGTLALDVRGERDGLDDTTPALQVHVVTDRMAFAPRVQLEHDIDGALVQPPPSWRLADVDFDLKASVDGHTGAVALATDARDRHGPLAHLEAKCPAFPFAELLHETGELPDRLKNTALSVDVAVPDRKLGALPAVLQQRYLSGQLHARASLRGTLLAPVADFDAALQHAGFAGKQAKPPMDLSVQAHYAGGRGTAKVSAKAEAKELVRADAELEADARQLARGAAGARPWTASVKAHVDGFPLQSVAALDDKLVSGLLRGDLSLTGLHGDAHLDADLGVDSLSVAGVPYESARLSLRAAAGKMEGRVRVDQSDGFAEAKAQAEGSWGSALLPALDPRRAMHATLSAKNLRLAALLPFVDGVFDRLDGRVDGDTHVELDPATRGAHLDGSVSLREGKIEAVAGGGELHDVAATVKLAPDGTLTLDRLTASGQNGNLEAKGTAHLEGTTLKDAHAEVSIPKAIPVNAEGAEVADVKGRLDLSAKGVPGQPLDVELDVPQLDVALPEGSTGNPQALGPMEKIHIGAVQGSSGRFVLLPLDPRPKKRDEPQDAHSAPSIALATHLHHVHMTRGAQLHVDLGGDLKVLAGGKTQVTGEIHLQKGGKLDVQGRDFSIDEGTVSFVGDDPSDPQVKAKASWKAPDGTIVYVEFRGPLKTGKVRLSSEPRMSKEEILQVLLFGSANGRQAQGGSDEAQNVAIAAAGTEAAQPLNHMLGQMGLGNVTARIDTSVTSSPKPEVEVQIARSLSLQIAVVLGQPPPGVNPDRTLVTLDWRFLKLWSLATTIGDAGTAIFDVLWQRRY